MRVDCVTIYERMTLLNQMHACTLVVSSESECVLTSEYFLPLFIIIIPVYKDSIS